MSLRYLILLVVICSSAALQYGRKGKLDRQLYPGCNRYDPEPIHIGSLNNLAGKRWNLIYAKLDNNAGKRIKQTDEILEFHKSKAGSNVKGIFMERLGSNPLICGIDQSEFVPLHGKEGKEWEFNSTVLGSEMLIKPYKYLYHDAHFLVSWECFERDSYGTCTDFFSGIFRDTRNQDIPYDTLQKISRSVKKKACLDFDRDYIREEIKGRKQCDRFMPFDEYKYW